MLLWILVGVLIGALVFGYARRGTPWPYYADWWPALIVAIVIILVLLAAGGYFGPR